MVTVGFTVLPEVCMRHDWIFDVLKDLSSYAAMNGMPALAAKADEALKIARAEVAAAEAPGDAGGGGIPPKGRAH